MAEKKAAAKSESNEVDESKITDLEPSSAKTTRRSGSQKIAEKRTYGTTPDGRRVLLAAEGQPLPVDYDAAQDHAQKSPRESRKRG